MDHPLVHWCLTNGLQSLGTKLEDLCGLQAVEELEKLKPTDTEEIVSVCQMNVGERIRFRNAIEKLQPGTARFEAFLTPSWTSR